MDLKNVKYTKNNYIFSNRFKEIKDSYQYVSLPYVNTPEATKRILFVVDYLPTEDLKSRWLLNGQTGEVLQILYNLATSIYLKKHKVVEKFSWAACSFNAFKTFGLPIEVQNAAKEEFAERVRSIIVKYKPDTVILFGDTAFTYLLPQQTKLTNGSVSPWHGVSVQEEVKFKKQSHVCNFVTNLSLDPIIKGNRAAVNMMGYMARRLAPGLYGSNPYEIDAKRIDGHKSVLIDTIPKFNKMLDMLVQKPVLAIDTETVNLNKVTNTLLTIQFAKCRDYGYLVPIYHKDSPFTTQELKFIVNRLKAFFEGQNRNEYHIYVNGLFDLNVLRTALGCRYMANAVFDVLGAEFCFDENQKWLQAVNGDYYYSLGNLAVQYGYTGYLTAEFSKQHRGSMATTDLSTPGFIKYCLSKDNHVLTSTGFKPISEILIGDMVMSYNHESSEVEAQPVLDVSEHLTTERMFEITYDGGTIKVTENHEVWSVTRNAYVKVKTLQEGEEILPVDSNEQF